ncbi:MAG: hypothetical protein IPP81_09550 [Chitinophagaceae bacterium]|nr:hypothetical protein [Chitinophagaceae bacterium]
MVKDLGVSANVAPNIVVTLTTFILGFLITWTAGYVSRFVKKIKYRRILKVIIRQYLDRCKLQIEELENFTKQKGFLHGQGFTIVMASNFSQTYLSNLDVKVFVENFSSIFKRGRAKQVAELFELIERIKFSKERLDEVVAKVDERYKDEKKIYDDNLTGIRKLQEDLRLRYHNKEVESEFASYLESIPKAFKNWIDKGAPTNMIDTLNGIVNPIYDSSVKVDVNEVSREMIDFTLNCRQAVVNLELGESVLREQILHTKEIHEKSYSKGIEILDDWS